MGEIPSACNVDRTFPIDHLLHAGKPVDEANESATHANRLLVKSNLPLIFFFGIFVALAGLSAGAQTPQPAFNTSMKPFIQAHCVDCHGADTHKAGLRLDTLAADFYDGKKAGTWERVFDKLMSGEMPPKKRERPPQRDFTAAVQFLWTQLYSASLAQQQKQGRVVVRRLNATEYENTLHDLLGTNVPLKDLLPEDASAAGFDNVSTALDLSPTHVLFYQQAAAKAIASVVPQHPPVVFSDTRDAREIVKRASGMSQAMNRFARMDGEALIIYGKLPEFNACKTAVVPAAGRYRVKMTASAVGTEGRPLTVGLLTAEETGHYEPALRDVRDIPADSPAVIEFEMDLAARQSFVVNMLKQWDRRGLTKPLAEYTGPGLQVEQLSIGGPIEEAFPPKSYESLFAGVPLKARSVAKAESEGAKPPTINEKRPVGAWLADPLMPASANPRKDAERLIRDFLPRAFRRPVSEEVAQHFIQRVLAKLDKKQSFFDAMTYGYKLILSSPNFLFLMELPAATATGDLSSPKLDDYSLAERLSYFLWSGPPDDDLLAAARKGELTKPATLAAQVERMLNSPRVHRFTDNFTGQWLDLRKMNFTIPDPQLYSDFDYLLQWSMPQETQLFFEEVLAKNLSLLEFVDSDWSMLNARLAELYGIPGVEGSSFRKVKLPAGVHRGGVMTHGSILKVTADGTRTSPVLRGKWILDRIIGKPPSPPPPDVPAIEPDIRGATTIRQLLDKHRNTPACATCHIHIDPPGFALETFDPIGTWRDAYRVTAKTPGGIIPLPDFNSRPVYRGPAVETGGQTPDGRAFKSIEDYKKILLENKDQLARSLTQKLIIYATGADIQFADREVVEQIVAKLRAKNYGFRTLVHEIVQSRVFLNK